MKTTVTNIITGEVTDHASSKLADMYIDQQVEWLNEEEQEKPKQEQRYWVGSVDFKKH